MRLEISIAFLFFFCASAWRLTDSFVGNNFYNGFDFNTYADPTHGFVKFVDEATARADGLIWTKDDYVYMGSDHKNHAPNGRNSIRVTTKKSWSRGLFVLILDHMAGGQCGTWPSWWTVGADWPNEGEIDIIEGVNRNTANQMTLHSGNGCEMPWSGRNETGRVVAINCDAHVNNNAGCGVLSTQPNSFGEGFSSAGGGAYAMEYTEKGVKTWFFTKSRMPRDIASNEPNPEWWPIPDAHFPFDGECSSRHFGNQKMVFDLTFCGDWAGSAYRSSGCPGECNEYVANNPNAFEGYYFGIRSLKVYQ
eukprot:TRINITY_DN14982_c0_g1_i1.p1 TRINITY_DN14982_c0_g1~~TRINITY_DN14982_c0_g1_i1.p1  ORF type:complete len:306 (-),score=70.62 TRINITY_DN14982_c0_g1_i1:40-957(-)